MVSLKKINGDTILKGSGYFPESICPELDLELTIVKIKAFYCPLSIGRGIISCNSVYVVIVARKALGVGSKCIPADPREFTEKALLNEDLYRGKGHQLQKLVEVFRGKGIDFPA